VWTIIAHDSAVRDGVEHFPKKLTGWFERGWGRDTRWAWFRDLEPYWKSIGLLKEGEGEKQ
jgi:hypothetical protein